ncbi:ABC transporter permease [Alicyclobacillus vulcanalis]|uniref:Putative ABC transport system permease protein n=1 Tax=Alicyclobacillus vulcanalis TaxID=252246 RepID=A0A1N7LJF2_9BACL|nr:iron export ABC transporter permease subunit FetB [Alicyclobacillus vulcanalis]SIS73978.1 putative ABC transport system permease protein [Alicyclobacillus vulcanalis]
MSYVSLSFTVLFVALSIALSLWLRLGVERDIIVAAVRAAIQLVVIGYILKWVFASHRLIFILLMVALIIGVAAWNARGRAKGIPGAFWRIAAGLVTTEILTQAVLVGFGVIPFQARYVITTSGMIVGNSMVAAGLLMNRLRREVESGRGEIMAILALGGSPRQAMYPRLVQAIRAGMIPTIDSTKTTGLVQLPGMMTGQIIAGQDPVQAVRYQLMILFCILAGSAVTSIVIGFLTYPTLFNRYQQLREDVIA